MLFRSELRDAVVKTSEVFDFGVDEMALAGLTPEPCRFVKPPRVKESPIAFECKFYQTLMVRKDLIDSGRFKSYADLKGLKMAVPAPGLNVLAIVN